MYYALVDKKTKKRVTGFGYQGNGTPDDCHPTNWILEDFQIAFDGDKKGCGDLRCCPDDGFRYDPKVHEILVISDDEYVELTNAEKFAP